MEQGLPHRTVVQPGERRLLGRIGQRKHPFAVQAPGPGVLGGGGDLRRAKAGQLGLVLDHEGRGLVGGEQLLLETRLQDRELFVQRLQPLLIGPTQLGAGPNEVQIGHLDQLQRLDVEVQSALLGVDGLHPREQPGIHVDGVVVGGQARRQLDLDLLQRLVGVRRGQGVEDAASPRQHPPRTLQRHDGVLEAGRRRIIGDRRDLGALLTHALSERRAEVVVLDLVELRRLERQGAGRGERAGVVNCGHERFLGRTRRVALISA